MIGLWYYPYTSYLFTHHPKHAKGQVVPSSSWESSFNFSTSEGGRRDCMVVGF